MPRYAFEVQYDGSAYSGWQKQSRQVTVQGEIEKALTTIFTASIVILGSGRTDSGVHARQQVFHADIDSKIDAPHKLMKSLRGVLPADILITSIYLVPDTFHARFDALHRGYSYIFTEKFNVFENRYRYVVPGGLPAKSAMFDAAGVFVGKHDFASFSKYNPDVLHSGCEVYKSTLNEIEEGVFEFSISANRFLHSMVRCLAGSIVQIGQEKYSMEEVLDRLNHPNINRPRFLAPPNALFLQEVHYDKSLWQKLV